MRVANVARWVGLLGVLGACTSFGSGEDGEADAGTPPVGPIDGGPVDGATVPVDGAIGRDATTSDASACKVSSGRVGAALDLPTTAPVVAYDASSDEVWLAGTEDCLGDATQRIAVYRVEGNTTPKRVACVGEDREGAVALDVDAGGIVVGTRFPAIRFEARLHRLDRSGAAKATVARVADGTRSYFTSAVKRAGAGDVWAYYAPASSSSASPAVGSIKVEPGGRVVTLAGETAIAGLASYPAGANLGLAAVELDLAEGGNGGAKVFAGRWLVAPSGIVRDPNTSVPTALPVTAQAQPLFFSQGSIWANADEAVVGFPVSASGYASVVPRVGNGLSVGPLGVGTAEVPVAVQCDGAVLVGHGSTNRNAGTVSRFARGSIAPDPAFAPVLDRAPTRVFSRPSGTLLVVVPSAPTRLVRVE